MRHGFHTAEQYPDKKHGNRRSRQHGKDDIGYAVFTMQFFGQEPEHFTGQPHCDNQYGHFVINVRLKSRVMPVVRKERVEQAERKATEALKAISVSMVARPSRSRFQASV